MYTKFEIQGYTVIEDYGGYWLEIGQCSVWFRNIAQIELFLLGEKKETK